MRSAKYGRRTAQLSRRELRDFQEQATHLVLRLIEWQIQVIATAFDETDPKEANAEYAQLNERWPPQP